MNSDESGLAKLVKDSVMKALESKDDGQDNSVISNAIVKGIKELNITPQVNLEASATELLEHAGSCNNCKKKVLDWSRPQIVDEDTGKPVLSLTKSNTIKYDDEK